MSNQENINSKIYTLHPRYSERVGAAKIVHYKRDELYLEQ
jgi:hypothetical protein